MRKILVRFFTITDYEQEEAWLRAQHKAGLRLVRAIAPCFYIFETCAPEDVVYRLDFKNDSQDAQYMQLIRDYGWEYFNSCMGWLYFRKPSSAPGSAGEDELFTDAAGKLDMIKRIIRTRMIPLLLIFLCCVLPNFTRLARNSTGADVFFWLFLALLLVYLWLFLHCGLGLKRLRRKYEGQ